MVFVVYLVKAAEDALQIGRFAADPGILDPKFDALRQTARSKNNLSLVGKFYRVVNFAAEHLV